MEKWVFASPTLELLGHMILEAGLAWTAEHTATIDSYPAPQDIKQFQRFLGMVNFYRRFPSGCACVLRPLTDLKGSPKCWS
jgi:putative transposase